MPTVRANGIDIYFEIKGTGDPLLLIAGFGCDHAIWGLIVATLAEHFRVYVFDNRGMGGSTGAETVASIQQMAADTAALMDALDLKSAHVTGHSMGGMIAQELAISRPKQVQSLILLSSCARLDNRGKAIIESWGDLPKWLDAEKASRLILPWIYTANFYANPRTIENVIALILANPAPPTAETLYGQSRAIASFDSIHRLPAISCPTLLLAGKQDILTPPAAIDQVARGIPHAELLLIEETGHGLLVETPEPVSAGMLSFLLRQPTSAARR
jgi:3-oxoadipate enol-lactonase